MSDVVTLEPRGPKSDVCVVVAGSCYECVACEASEQHAFATPCPSAMFRHLLRHTEAGDRVRGKILRYLARRSAEVASL